uniref:Uncharacterized protein n=1 Tax=Aegilops tauschii TaxID=37682 RepID=M8BIQ4_AEGTA
MVIKKGVSLALHWSTLPVDVEPVCVEAVVTVKSGDNNKSKCAFMIRKINDSLRSLGFGFTPSPLRISVFTQARRRRHPARQLSSQKTPQSCTRTLEVNHEHPITCLQVERDVETVINVLQPGPIGIVEHKFTDAEIREAQVTVRSAVEKWRRNSALERNLGTGSFHKSK